MGKHIITTNETGPIKEKHTLMERIFNQRYILESQGLLFNNTYDLTKYTIQPEYEEDNWSKINNSFVQFGMATLEAAKALSKLSEVYENERRKDKR